MHLLTMPTLVNLPNLLSKDTPGSKSPIRRLFPPSFRAPATTIATGAAPHTPSRSKTGPASSIPTQAADDMAVDNPTTTVPTKLEFKLSLPSGPNRDLLSMHQSVLSCIFEAFPTTRILPSIKGSSLPPIATLSVAGRLLNRTSP